MSFFRDLARDLIRGLESRVDYINPPKVAEGDITNGDVSILSLHVFKEQSWFDLMSQVTEIHIYESIVSPAIYCTMEIADAINLQEDYQVRAGDIIKFEFQTPGTSQSSEYLFKVNREIVKRDVPGLTMKVSTLEMISVEALEAQNVLVGEIDLRDTAGKVIERIVKEKILPTTASLNPFRRFSTRLDIDSARGIVSRNELQLNAVGANRKPFELIHQVALLANRSPEGDSLYTFFERKDGYYFKPIEKLIREGKAKIRDGESTDKLFYYDHLRNQEQSAVKFRNILAYNIANEDNIAEGRGFGVNTEASITNPVTGEITYTDRPDIDNYTSDLTCAVLLREFELISTREIITSTEFDHLSETLVSRRNLLLRMSQFEAQIMIYGDTELSVGDVIECNFPRSISTSPESSAPNQSSELSADSGIFIITHLRHMILNTDRPQHIISCNLMRAEPKRNC